MKLITLVGLAVVCALAAGCGEREAEAPSTDQPGQETQTDAGMGQGMGAKPSGEEGVVCCHLCGMFVSDPERIQVRDVPVGPWPQCCPVCAIVDVLESTETGSGTIIAHDDLTDERIEVKVEARQVASVEPEGAVVLFGGSCVMNKSFVTMENAEKFKADTDWAADKPIKSWAEMVTMLASKKSRVDRCAVCTADLTGHENTWFIAMTKDKKRKVCCCAHCGIFLYLKEKDNIKNMVTADYGTLEYMPARDAFYVVGHDQVTCCVPATAAFALREDAEEFAAAHGGNIYTLDEAIANIEEVMKTE